MKSLPEGIALGDINQWLFGGWFFFKKDDDAVMEPARLLMSEERGNTRVTTEDGTEYDICRKRMFPYWPQCGAINMNGFAAFVERRQVRQYRRTYNDQCVTVRIPRKWDVMKKHGTAAAKVDANTPQLVGALFDPQYYTYPQAQQLMDEGHATSIALNRHLTVAGPLVYQRNEVIAKINQDKIVPIGAAEARVHRILKFFEGRVSL